MTLITLLFFAHQPERFRASGERPRVTDLPPLGLSDSYFVGAGNRHFCVKVARK